MGKGQEMFDAELLGLASLLEWALERELQGPIYVFLDARNAISRLQLTAPGPGQALALKAHDAATKLVSKGCLVTVQWVPGHIGIKSNEQTDRAATFHHSFHYLLYYSLHYSLYYPFYYCFHFNFCYLVHRFVHY